MLTEVATGHRVLVDAVAESIAEAEEARLMRRDATAMVERMAVHARTAGVEHPVAAAVARAARVSELIGPEEFADRHGVPIARLVEAEAGTVRFGDLPSAYDAVLASLGIDLLSLADLEAGWRMPAPTQTMRV
jgi:hypothetical protein